MFSKCRSGERLPASVKISGEKPISFVAIGTTSAPSIRAISCAPRHTPNIGLPDASRRPIHSASAATKG